MSESMTLTEELEQRMTMRPDKYTLAWWEKRFEDVKQGYRGAAHNINCAVASVRDCWGELKKQREENAQLKRDLEASNATIGELKSELTKLSERVERLAEWANKQKGAAKS